MTRLAVPALGRREPVIRALREGDLAPMAAAEKEIFDLYGYPYFVIRQNMAMYGDFYTVAVTGDELMGFALCPPRVDGRTAVLLGWGVLPRFRGFGVGTKLLDHAVGRLRGMGVASIELTVEPDNLAAITQYRRAGFTFVRTEADYFGPGEDRDIMVLDLDHARNQRRTSSAKNTLTDSAPK